MNKETDHDNQDESPEPQGRWYHPFTKVDVTAAAWKGLKAAGAQLSSPAVAAARVTGHGIKKHPAWTATTAMGLGLAAVFGLAAHNVQTLKSAEVISAQDLRDQNLTGSVRGTTAFTYYDQQGKLVFLSVNPVMRDGALHGMQIYKPDPHVFSGDFEAFNQACMILENQLDAYPTGILYTGDRVGAETANSYPWAESLSIEIWGADSSKEEDSLSFRPARRFDFIADVGDWEGVYLNNGIKKGLDALQTALTHCRQNPDAARLTYYHFPDGLKETHNGIFQERYSGDGMVIERGEAALNELGAHYQQVLEAVATIYPENEANISAVKQVVQQQDPEPGES